MGEKQQYQHGVNKCNWGKLRLFQEGDHIPGGFYWLIYRECILNQRQRIRQRRLTGYSGNSLFFICAVAYGM